MSCSYLELATGTGKQAISPQMSCSYIKLFTETDKQAISRQSMRWCRIIRQSRNQINSKYNKPMSIEYI